MEQKGGVREGEESSSPLRKRVKTDEDLFRPPPSELKQEPAAAKGDGGGTLDATAAEEKSVYLFVCNMYGSNFHTLYAVDIPLPDSMSETPELKPLLQFPRVKFPFGLCAVEFDSKIYFFGGEFEDRAGFCPCPSDVYIFDPSSSSSSLKVGPKMNGGKVRPLVFVADSKIYALSGLEYLSSESMDIYLSPRFEVFKPDNDGGTWTQLEDPPFGTILFTGHAVINKHVFISTLNDDFLCYDLDSCKWWRKILGDPYWTEVSKPTRGWEAWGDTSYPPPLLGDCTELVEGTLYSLNEECRVYPFGGPLVAYSDNKSKIEEEEEKLYERVAFLSFDISNLQQPTIANPEGFLTHIGKKRFCRVVFGNPRDPRRPLDLYGRDLTKCYVQLTVLEASDDPYSEAEDGTIFCCKILQSGLFVIESGGYSSLSHVFTLPSLCQSTR